MQYWNGTLFYFGLKEFLLHIYRGQLDYEKPVSHYWPEFAQNGKDKITLKQLISNQVRKYIPYRIHIRDKPLCILVWDLHWPSLSADFPS